MFCVPNPKHQKIYKNHVKKRREMILKLAVIQIMMAWSSNLIVEGKTKFIVRTFFLEDVVYFIVVIKNSK